MSVDNDSLAATGILEVPPSGQGPTGPPGLTDSAASLSATSPLAAGITASTAGTAGTAGTGAGGLAQSTISTGPGTGFTAVRLIAGRYEILSLIGQGGMGRVYRARDTELDEVVALKVLQSDLVSSPEMVERFRREVKLARRVTHPNVARMFDMCARWSVSRRPGPNLRRPVVHPRSTV